MNSHQNHNSSIRDILRSIACEETALAKMLNTEGEKLQKGICLAECVDELIKINCSVTNTIVDVTNLEIVLYNKLKAAMSCEVGQDNCPDACGDCCDDNCCDNCNNACDSPRDNCKKSRCICIQGVVTDCCGNRLCNAQVVAIGKNKKITNTNRYGHYRIDMLEAADKFTITAECGCNSSEVFECDDDTYYYYHHDIQIDCAK